MLDASFNDEKSPVQQDPYVSYGSDRQGNARFLRLALNTDQYGRTFEDRSHMFVLSKRPNYVTDVSRIINLNVRGKRGNIVQAYPAVEYDFVPNQLQVNTGDYIHFQWTGCDTNPNYAGEGTQGTDRSNIVQLADSRDNIPVKFEDQTMFTTEKAFLMAHLNQYGGRVCQSTTDTNCCFTYDQLKAIGGNVNENVQNCAKLNDPNAAYFDGAVVQMKTPGTYYYMSSRNNNFSNRSQKGTITVGSLLPIWGIVVASAAGIAFIGGSIIAGGVYFAQTHPGSSVANVFANVRL
jgi:plastocyanin